MKNEQCLEGNLRLQAKADGIDVDALDKEFQEIGVMMDQARINVRKKRGWLKHFLIVLWTEFPIPMLGYVHPEERQELERLKKIKEDSGLSS